MRSGRDPAIPARIGPGACGAWARTCSLRHKKRASSARRLSKVAAGCGRLRRHTRHQVHGVYLFNAANLGAGHRDNVLKVQQKG